jgi:hypothetical protein
MAAVAIACGVFLAVSRGFHRTAPVTLSYLSVSNNNSGVQFAFFTVSNCTSRGVDYMSDGTPQPCYSMMEWLPLDANTVLVTNYNLEQQVHAKPATLPPHSSLTFPVCVPSGVTGAVLRVEYRQHRSHLEEKALKLVETYVRRLPSSNPWKNAEVQQPFL